jgi:hypothetical protein
MIVSVISMQLTSGTCHLRRQSYKDLFDIEYLVREYSHAYKSGSKNLPFLNQDTSRKNGKMNCAVIDI